MKRIAFEVILFALASPWLILEMLFRAAWRLRFLCVAYATSFRCRVCGSTVSLVGAWRCSCGYTYRGHLLRTCPVCRSVPRMARCFRCGSTARLPEP